MIRHRLLCLAGINDHFPDGGFASRIDIIELFPAASAAAKMKMA
jgi:hypothetical protein